MVEEYRIKFHEIYQSELDESQLDSIFINQFVEQISANNDNANLVVMFGELCELTSNYIEREELCRVFSEEYQFTVEDSRTLDILSLLYLFERKLIDCSLNHSELTINQCSDEYVKANYNFDVAYYALLAKVFNMIESDVTAILAANDILVTRSKNKSSSSSPRNTIPDTIIRDLIEKYQSVDAVLEYLRRNGLLAMPAVRKAHCFSYVEAVRQGPSNIEQSHPLNSASTASAPKSSAIAAPEKTFQIIVSDDLLIDKNSNGFSYKIVAMYEEIEFKHCELAKSVGKFVQLCEINSNTSKFAFYLRFHKIILEWLDPLFIASKIKLNRSNDKVSVHCKDWEGNKINIPDEFGKIMSAYQNTVCALPVVNELTIELQFNNSVNERRVKMDLHGLRRRHAKCIVDAIFRWWKLNSIRFISSSSCKFTGIELDLVVGQGIHSNKKVSTAKSALCNALCDELKYNNVRYTVGNNLGIINVFLNA